MRKIQGTIVSNKMNHTVVVRVDALKKHPKYKKYYRSSRKFKAHADEHYTEGDIVIMQETRPLSKEKRWKITSIVKKAAEVTLEEVAEPGETA